MHPTSVAAVLHTVTREPGRPRLTWYGDGAERVELSGAVLDNWVNKTVNLLVEELDVGPGTRVELDLPPHWRTVVWALATWRAGACVEIGQDAGTASAADVIVTPRPRERASARGAVIAVALPALSRKFPGDLPASAIDAAGAVMTYGDTLGWTPVTVPADDALVMPGRTLTHAGLLEEALDRDVAAGARVLLTAPDDAPASTSELVLATLAALAVDGSVVGIAASVAAELTPDPVRRERLVTSERVTTV